MLSIIFVAYTANEFGRRVRDGRTDGDWGGVGKENERSLEGGEERGMYVWEKWVCVCGMAVWIYRVRVYNYGV